MKFRCSWQAWKRREQLLVKLSSSSVGGITCSQRRWLSERRGRESERISTTGSIILTTGCDSPKMLLPFRRSFQSISLRCNFVSPRQTSARPCPLAAFQQPCRCFPREIMLRQFVLWNKPRLKPRTACVSDRDAGVTTRNALVPGSSGREINNLYARCSKCRCRLRGSGVN